MTDDNQSTGIKIPADLKDQYPDIIEGILKSVSMDDKERRYWISVLPTMTKDQVDELRDILEEEQEKLAKINEKPKEKNLSKEDIQSADEERLARRTQRREEEQKSQAKVEQEAEDFLNELNDL